MIIHKVLVDKKPSECLLCPLKHSGVKLNLKCGVIKTEPVDKGGWQTTHFVPDERCKFEEVKMESNNSKPPIGIMPKKIWDYTRMENLKEAIYRYCEAGKEVPFEWIDEYNSLINLYSK